MRIAILGAGAGGASAAVQLSQLGHAVRLWNRTHPALEGFKRASGIYSSGVFGEMFTPLAVITTDLAAAANDAELLLVCLPTMAHGALAGRLVDGGIAETPVLLNPGHTGGALEFSQVFRLRGLPPPPVAELSTLTYVARKLAPEHVAITGVAKRVRIAALPGGEAALERACAVYECAEPVHNVLITGLSNVNMVLHPPGAVCGASWIEATSGDFHFYVEGLTDGVGRVMQQLDDERRAVGRGFGFELPALFDEMQAIGTIEAGSAAEAGLAQAIRSGEANRRIKAPNSFAHRYFHEDFWYGLQPFLTIANIADIEVPTAHALMHLGQLTVGPAAPAQGRSAAAMGIAGFGKSELLDFIKVK